MPVTLTGLVSDAQSLLPIDDATVTVTTPEEGASAPFTAMLDVPGGEFAGWRYQVAG